MFQLPTKHLPWGLACLGLIATLSVRLEKAASDEAATPLRDLGVPVRSVNWVHLHAGHNHQGAACLYAVMGQTAENLFVLQIDPETGKFRQFVSQVPSANFPTATLMSRVGRLYVGAAYAGHLLCFDPAKDALEDLGAIHPGAASFPCRMDEDDRGRIWIGSYPAADLTCYDPVSREFVRYGRMDDVDMYDYPFVGSDGTVASLVQMTRPHVVTLDPQTRQKQTIGPLTTRGKESIDLCQAKDGRLYIRSSRGNFRIDGMKAVPVDVVPSAPAPPTLPGVRSFAFADAAAQVYRKLEVRKTDGTVRMFTLEYTASGSDIFCLHAGPDGCVYGSSYLPLHLFRYRPQGSALVDLGQCSETSGEAYSMANFQGKVYISAYCGAVLSVFDPARPCRFGSRPDDNPRGLGRMDDISCRPRSTLAGPLGRIWVASVPDYGRWGGPLTCYDPATGKKTPYYRIVGDGSCYTLAHLEKEKLLAVGTSVDGGSGTQPKVGQAVLFLWDYQAERKVWEGTLDRPVSAINALLAGSDGRLYGTVVGGKQRPELFVFDSTARAFKTCLALPSGSPLDLGLQYGPDGKVYGFTSDCIYRVDPQSQRLEEVVRAKGTFNVAGPILGDNIYFATRHRLRAARLFGQGGKEP